MSRLLGLMRVSRQKWKRFHFLFHDFRYAFRYFYVELLSFYRIDTSIKYVDNSHFYRRIDL